MSTLRDSTVFLTGGTGSFGTEFVKHTLRHVEPRQIVVFSRDELKQYEMRQALGDDERLRWALGDVRDRDCLVQAMRGADYVVHAAAMKQVDTAEYHPQECTKTNVFGSQNVIAAATETGVRKVVALSTDKASSPINLYGATKMVADKLFISANARSEDTAFSVVRDGNLMGSRGSVIPMFRRLAAEGLSLPITDKQMTRFWVTMNEAVRFVIDCFDSMEGGELFVPKIPSITITDLAEAIAPGTPTYEIGIRPGEKMHEEMIAVTDSQLTIELEDQFVVLPTVGDSEHAVARRGRRVPTGFAYQSDTNDRWLSIDELNALLAHDET